MTAPEDLSPGAGPRLVEGTVADDDRQLGFVVHVRQDAARDVDVAAWKCEGIDDR